MAQVLNYHDAVVYDTDVELFREGGWLNDNCINWFFRYLEHEVFRGKDDVLFMDPAVVSCLVHQCDEAEEFHELGRGIGLEAKGMVFVPINNASDLFARGTHWSLLVFERGTKDGFRFRHYDSCRGQNSVAAEGTAAHFVKMFGPGADEGESPARVEHIRGGPQQQNGYDCGMYTIVTAEHLAAEALGRGGRRKTGASGRESTETLAGAISPAVVSNARALAKDRLLRCIREEQEAALPSTGTRR